MPSRTHPLTPLRTELFLLFLAWTLSSVFGLFLFFFKHCTIAQDDCGMTVLWSSLQFCFTFCICCFLLSLCRQVRKLEEPRREVRQVLRVWMVFAVLYFLGRLLEDLALPLLLACSDGFCQVFRPHQGLYASLIGWGVGSLFPGLPLLLSGVLLRRWKLAGLALALLLLSLTSLVPIDMSTGFCVFRLLFRSLMQLVPCALLLLWTRTGPLKSRPGPY